MQPENEALPVVQGKWAQRHARRQRGYGSLTTHAYRERQGTWNRAQRAPW